MRMAKPNPPSEFDLSLVPQIGKLPSLDQEEERDARLGAGKGTGVRGKRTGQIYGRWSAISAIHLVK
jgi:hypothetical protein